MKKLFISTLALCLVGCSNQASSVTSTPTPTPEVVTKTIWNTDPQFTFDDVMPMPALSKKILKVETQTLGEVILYVESEKTGSSSQWNVSNNRGDAVLVEQNGKQGIYNYEGEELYAVSVAKVSTPFIQGITEAVYTKEDGTVTTAFGYANTSNSTAQIFTSDFTSTQEVAIDSFDYEGEKASNVKPYLCYQNGVVGIAGMTYSESGAMRGWTFEPWTIAGVSTNVIVPQIDDSFAKVGYVVLSSDGTLLANVNTSYPYREGSYVDGYYVVANSDYATVVHDTTGSGVAVQYQDAQYYSEGYMAVKKSGKWGYINAEGKEVTDFIFEDVTPVYQGKAWVKYNGQYGILDFSNAMQDEELQINAYWAKPSEEESIGTVTVNISNLTIRSGASSSDSQVGLCMNGATYPYFEEQQNGDYTWYRINKDEWIASEGTWVTVEK